MILAIVSLPLMLFSLCLITASALANDIADTEGFIASSENPSAVAAPDQDSGSGTAANTPSEISLSQLSLGTPSADSSVSGTAGDQSSTVNETISGSENQSTSSRQGNSALETNSQSPATSAAAPNNATGNTSTSSTATAASQEAGRSEPPAYELHLVCSAGDRGTYWDSREDYDARLLSIDYSLSNTGTGTAYNVQVTAATANRGVTVATTLPLSLGDLISGGQILFTLKWLVPRNVASFTTDITACADSKDDDEDGDDDDGDDDDGGDEDGDNDGGDEEDLNGDKPPGDGGQLNYTPDNAADGSIGDRTSQNNLPQYSIVRSALPSTGFAGLDAALALITIALLACGALLALPATVNGNRRRH